MTLSGELAVSIVISLPTILFTLANVSQNSKNRQPSTTMNIIDYVQNSFLSSLRIVSEVGIYLDGMPNNDVIIIILAIIGKLNPMIFHYNF